MSDHHILSRSTPVSCAVITVSDTRTPDTDTSGAMMQEMLRTIGCTVQYYTILPDEPTQIRAQILTWLDIVDVILLNGGTGIS